MALVAYGEVVLRSVLALLAGGMEKISWVYSSMIGVSQKLSDCERR